MSQAVVLVQAPRPEGDEEAAFRVVPVLGGSLQEEEPQRATVRMTSTLCGGQQEKEEEEQQQQQQATFHRDKLLCDNQQDEEQEEAPWLEEDRQALSQLPTPQLSPPLPPAGSAEGGALAGQGSQVSQPADEPFHLVLPMFDYQRFRFWRVQCQALRSGGQIQLHLDLVTGSVVAVKILPRQRLRETPQAFARAFPDETENPWQELLMAERFGHPGPDHLPFMGLCHGAFRNAQGDVLMVMEYIPGGDLFDIACCDESGMEREQKAWPIVRSLLDAVLGLHARGVAHGDVSLENVLRRASWCGSGIVLVDFGMAVTEDLASTERVRGKPSYQAPEMHTQATYDARAADIFAVGVVAYALCVKGYPWTSTRPGACCAFTYTLEHGLEALFQKRTIKGPGGVRRTVASMISPTYKRLLQALLDFEPERRAVSVRLASFRELFIEFPEVLWGG